MFDTIFFDCDSTLTTLEGIDEVTQDPQLKKEAEELTQRAMNGEIDFETACEKRYEILSPTDKKFKRVGELYIKNTFPGAKELIQKLHKRGAEVFILSGGYIEAIAPFAKHLNIPIKNIIANQLDKTHPHLRHPEGKAKIIQEWRKQNPKKTIAMVGDGVTDLVTEPFVDRFIGFGGVHVRPQVKSSCSYYYEGPNLLDLIPLLT